MLPPLVLVCIQRNLSGYISMKRTILFFSVFFVLTGITFANTSPVVSNITVSQRTDGSGIVDIYYTLSDADNDHCTVSIEVSDDGGSSWNVIATSFSADSDIGENISCGNRHITWNSKADLPGEVGNNYRIKVTANDNSDSLGMTWVYIDDDTGLLGFGPFQGYMSKYETTNAQFCQYLNDALTSGDITIGPDGIVYGAIGSNSGVDYINEPYFKTYPSASIYSQISYSDGVFDVRDREGFDMSDHPVVVVSWYGVMAFADYYGYRLPQIWEWQSVGDFDGSFIYGCGLTINRDMANYFEWNPLGLSSYPYTSPVGNYPDYGYGLCDMAGNVFEWTGTYKTLMSGGTARIYHGGGWASYSSDCKVLYETSPYYDALYDYPDAMYSDLGFRVVRD